METDPGPRHPRALPPSQVKPDDLIATRYRLLRPIGRGAMGTVWAARHELLGRDFALKFATIPTKTDSTARHRFQREAQLVAKLRHPNIVDVTDFGEVAPDGDLFLVMELLEGESLAECITRRGSLDSYEAVSIAADVARGLAAVHAVGIVHRDVKPENIFLARSATGSIVPKLIDFGISKEGNDSLATQHGALTGTPAYMSPEQANGETTLNPSTDIWSLGVVLYEMLTGKHPFVEQNYQALMGAIAERPHIPLDATMPAAVCRLVDRCLAKRPADRFSTADELADALAELCGSPPQKRRAVSRRVKHALTAITGTLVAATVAAMVLLKREEPAAPVESYAHAPSSSVAATILTSAAPIVLPTVSLSASATTASTKTTQPNPASPAPAPTTRPSSDKRTITSVTTPGF